MADFICDNVTIAVLALTLLSRISHFSFVIGQAFTRKEQGVLKAGCCSAVLVCRPTIVVQPLHGKRRDEFYNWSLACLANRHSAILKI